MSLDIIQVKWCHNTVCVLSVEVIWQPHAKTELRPWRRVQKLEDTFSHEETLPTLEKVISAGLTV